MFDPSPGCRRQSARGGVMGEWQWIETAPRDGSHILVYRLPVGFRFTNKTNPPTIAHWFDDPDEPGFYTSVNELAPEHPFDATHWMPLSAPPASLRR
jgi:hypothetical protein